MSRGLNLRVSRRRLQREADRRRKERLLREGRFRRQKASSSAELQGTGPRPMPRPERGSGLHPLSGGLWHTDLRYRSTCKRIRADNERRSAAHDATVYSVLCVAELRALERPSQVPCSRCGRGGEKNRAAAQAQSRDSSGEQHQPLPVQSAPATNPVRHSPSRSAERPSVPPFEKAPDNP